MSKSHKPRIYIAIETLWPVVGGAERQALAHARSLRERGLEATVVTLRHDRAWRRHEVIEGVPVRRVAGGVAGGRERFPAPLRKMAYLLGLLMMAWTVWRHRRRYDILCVYKLNLLAAPAALACLLAGKPMVISSRCADSGGATGTHPAPLAPGPFGVCREAGAYDISDAELLERLGAPVLRLTRYLLRRAHAVVIVLSSRMEGELAAHDLRLPATLCIPNGVDATRFVPAPARTDLPEHERARTVVCVSRLNYQKGVDMLLHAWQIVHAQAPAVRLIVVGTGPLRHDLERLAGDLGVANAVEFAGLQGDVPAQLHRAGVAVLASRWEGMPNAVLEAMACGLPCVGTRVSGSEDIIQHGVNGLLVDPDDYRGMAAALLTLLRDPALMRDYGRAARATIEQHYALERITDRYVALYETLMQGGHLHRLSTGDRRVNVRKALYFSNHRRHGSRLGRFYEDVVREDRWGVPPDTTRRLLIEMLAHCQRSVPYYSASIGELGDSFKQDPESYLARFPILTKDVIRQHFDRLTSTDKARRHRYFNTSGGSTGEPIKLMQDQEYGDRSTAITLLYSRWTGWRVGEPLVYLWGSERDILQDSLGFKVGIANRILNRTFLNAFRMAPRTMHEFIGVLNAKRPKLIIAYAQAAYELATFVERERVAVRPQSAIMTSAGTLYPFMREKIETVFGCKIFDRYGSREVGDMACECTAHEGLHVAPWGSYIEIVDDDGRVVPRGTDGNIVVTSLTNFAMPLIRYSIGDRGVLSPSECCSCGRRGQILERVLGRNVDTFKAQDGTLVDGEYFTHLLYFRDWVRKFQVIQKSRSAVVYKIVKSEADYDPAELDDIADKTKVVLGRDCTVSFELVDDIPPSASGKYRYTISDISR